jgi:hypothetical protein
MIADAGRWGRGRPQARRSQRRWVSESREGFGRLLGARCGRRRSKDGKEAEESASWSPRSRPLKERMEGRGCSSALAALCSGGRSESDSVSGGSRRGNGLCNVYVETPRRHVNLNYTHALDSECPPPFVASSLTNGRPHKVSVVPRTNTHRIPADYHRPPVRHPSPSLRCSRFSPCTQTASGPRHLPRGTRRRQLCLRQAHHGEGHQGPGRGQPLSSSTRIPSRRPKPAPPFMAHRLPIHVSIRIMLDDPRAPAYFPAHGSSESRV